MRTGTAEAQYETGEVPDDPPPLRLTHTMFSPGWGGAERFVVDLVRELARRGHTQQVVVRDAFPRADRLEAVGGVRVDRVPARGNWDLPSLRRLKGLVADWGPDLIHANLARATWMSGRVGRRLGVPVVTTAHNALKAKYCRNVDAFASITRSFAEVIASRGVPPERIEWIPNFSTLDPVDAPPPVERDPPRFVALGRFVPKKGFDVLLEALARVRDDLLDGSGDAGAGARTDPPLLRLAGAGPEEAALRKRAAELGLEAAVEFTGWVEDVMAFLASGDVFVLPSRVEPFGIVMLEAMAAGKAIVSTRTAGPVEVLDDDTAWLAEPGDARSLAEAMMAAATDRGGRRARARASLDLFRREYTADAVVPRYEALYRRVLRR